MPASLKYILLMVVNVILSIFMFLIILHAVLSALFIPTDIKNSINYISTKCTIMSSGIGIGAINISNNTMSYVAKYQVQYSVNNTTYQSVVESDEFTKPEAQQNINENPNGRVIDCYYNKKDPNQSKLQLQIIWPVFIIEIFLIVILSMGRIRILRWLKQIE